MPTAAKEIILNEKTTISSTSGLFLIAGPCVIENEEHTLWLAKTLQKITSDMRIPFIFKASFDKANRSSIKSYRGPGLDQGLNILATVKKTLGIPVLSDIHEPSQAEPAAAVLDIIQIPAFLCRQTDLILAAARTGKPLNLKKGQFLSPGEMRNVIDKALSQGNDKLILTERGTCFGYNNLVFDVRSIPIMKEWGFPVVIDASHSVQRPGGKGTASGGEAQFIPTIARAAVAAGADGIFIEVHDHPERALSDGPNSWPLAKLPQLLAELLQLYSCLHSPPFLSSTREKK
mgnify:CR=1 FL=1|jgi:2-dehydro-3-deoxyphosphooctonate aldolase (KDO 8-P synthase)